MASHLVSQHQLSSYATPVNGGAGDATVVLGNDNATVTGYNGHDSDATIHVQDSSAAVFVATPAGTAGRKWMTNDTGGVYLYYDTGSVWVEVNYLRNTGGTVTGTITCNALTTATDASGKITVGRYGAAANAFSYFLMGATSTGFKWQNPSAVDMLTLTDTGALAMVSGQKFYFDGVAATGDSYMWESSANTIRIVTAGTDSLVVSATASSVAGTFTSGGLLTASAGATIASGQTLTLTGATVAGTPTWSSSQAITLSTAAQPNITSVGTLTSLAVGAITSTGQIKTTLTTQQLSLNYDASNHLAVTVNSTGTVTLNATGASAQFIFSDQVTVNGLIVSNITSADGVVTVGAADSGGVGYRMLRVVN